MSTFKETKDGLDYFNFVCEGCGCEGEIGIPRKDGMKPFGCPEGCGATYVRWNPSRSVAEPTLRCVVKPYFREAEGQ
jgi:hypothetical protein